MPSNPYEMFLEILSTSLSRDKDSSIQTPSSFVSFTLLIVRRQQLHLEQQIYF